MAERVKDEPICFRPVIGMRIEIERQASKHHMSLAEWVEAIVNREVANATAAQGTADTHDSAPAV